MNQLMTLNENGKVTSLELVEQINFFRQVERDNGVTGRLVNNTTHSDLLKIIRYEFEDEALSGELTEKLSASTGGRPSKYYELTPSQAKQILVRESKSVRKAVIKYIEELEKQLSALILPKTYISALEAFLESEKQKEQLRIEAEQLAVALIEAKPKVEYYDIILNSTDTMTIKQIAEDYGLSANKLNTILHESNIQYKEGRTWYLYSEHKGCGLTESKTYRYDRIDGSEGVKVHMSWTQKGRLLIHEILTKLGHVANYDKSTY